MSDATPSPQPTSQRVSPALIVMLMIPLLGIAAALGLLLAEQSNIIPEQLETSTGRPLNRVGSLDSLMPQFTTITDLDGGPVDLKEFAGRPLFVNFWGTWCPPCIDELPELQAFAAAQDEDGALVIASNNTESPETIRAYFDENGLDLPDIWFVQDTESEMYRWFGVFQMPTTFVIDTDGVVRLVKYGPFREDEPQTYLDELAKLQ